MSNPIEKSIPFAVKLQDSERYRLKDGQLIVEDKSIRYSSGAWTRFWTRGQYSQSAILKEMGKLYKKAMEEQRNDQECHLTQTFLENYKTLIDRASAQNREYKYTSSFVRFFEAKSEIDTSSAETEIKEIEKELAPKDPNSASEKMKKALADTKRKHEKALADEKQKKEKALADTKQKHEKAIADAKQKQDQDLAAKRKEQVAAQKQLREEAAAQEKLRKEEQKIAEAKLKEEAKNAQIQKQKERLAALTKPSEDELIAAKAKLKALEEAGGPTEADVSCDFETLKRSNDRMTKKETDEKLLELAKAFAQNSYDRDLKNTKTLITKCEDAIKLLTESINHDKID